MANFHIIGTGLAGLAAATHIARAGHFVQLYEATNSAGGRCALLRDEHRNDGYDGCNALLFGGNGALKRYADLLGSGHSLMTLDSGGAGYDVKRKQPSHRPAFLLPPSLPLVDALQLLRLRFAGAGTQVDDMFDYYHPLTETYVEPLSRGLMLCDPAKADASLLARRAWSILRRGRKGLKLMAPRVSLYHSLVEPALRQVEHEGGTVYYSHVLKKIVCKDGMISGLQFTKQMKELRPHDRVILALPAHVLQQLAPDGVPATLHFTDVVSVHFHTKTEGVRLVPVTGGSIDWVRVLNGVVTALSYAPERLLPLHDGSIAKRVWAEVETVLGFSMELPPYRVVRSRRAHAGNSRRSALPQRYLANGFLAGELFGPARMVPMEAAIASGVQAAEQALASLGTA